MREVFHGVDLHGIGFRQAIDLLGSDSRNARTGIVAEIDIFERIEVGACAPVIGTRIR